MFTLHISLSIVDENHKVDVMVPPVPVNEDTRELCEPLLAESLQTLGILAEEVLAHLKSEEIRLLNERGIQCLHTRAAG